MTETEIKGKREAFTVLLLFGAKASIKESFVSIKHYLAKDLVVAQGDLY